MQPVGPYQFIEAISLCQVGSVWSAIDGQGNSYTVAVLAKEHGVDYQSGASDTESIQGSTLERLVFSLTLAGDYNDIRAMIHDLETAPEFIVIDNIVLSEGRDPNAPLTWALELSTYYRSAAARARIDGQSLQMVGVHPDEMRHQQLDHVGVRDHHDRLVRMSGRKRVELGCAARLHLEQGLAAGEPNRRRRALHYAP